MVPNKDRTGILDAFQIEFFLLHTDDQVFRTIFIDKFHGHPIVHHGGVDAEELEAAIASQTVRVVAERARPDGSTLRIVETPQGLVLAAAGVDSSDVPQGTALLLPEDPDESARRLRRGLDARLGVRPAVIITDTVGRPWRQGVADIAIGAAGVLVLEDHRGRRDGYGRELRMTTIAAADEIAAAAELVKGKAEGRPVAVVRGLAHLTTREDGDGARALVRPPEEDLFRRGG